MTETSSPFIVKFNDVSSAQSNQLAEELRRALGTIPEGLQVERLKEDPNTLDEGGSLLFLIATAAASIHSPSTMAEAMIAAILVDFAYRHGASLQIKDEFGKIFQIAKDISHATLDETKEKLREFLQKMKKK